MIALIPLAPLLKGAIAIVALAVILGAVIYFSILFGAYVAQWRRPKE